MDVTCSKCKRKIDANNINVAKDTAFCSSCERLTSLSDILQSTPSKNFRANSPVQGTTLDDQGYMWTVCGSHRSWMALFFVPFTMVWAGGSLSGIYVSQIIKGEFDVTQSLFGLPFLIGSIVLISVCLMSVFGRTLISVENGKALVFIGVGSIGWYRRFDWKTIDRVTEKHSGQYKYISLEGSKRINLGWGLNGKKQYYIANFLRTKL
ncbi:hypothetical protein KJ365_04180 [Glaciecola sp. XM2]|jgi:hypothetical protein|uniref:hypothetical protein n=1 Tax=Glaciecola sp. XM2 TaxID=1914931 RepID=UPI001BDE7A42|nr:hypothetical protein [Glaciecola sp. XM2]MBT1450067.1 hypothetical protein [Glaciecola sp. XM2]